MKSLPPLLDRLGVKARQRSERLDREFLAPAQQIIETPPSPLWRNIALAICIFFALALIISWFAHIDIYAVAAGRVQPLGRSKVVQPLDTGRVIAVHVRNGSQVRAGQLLIELDPTDPAATKVAASDQGQALAAEIARRHIEIEAASSRRFSPVPAIPPYGLSPEYQQREQAVLAGDLDSLGATIAGIRAKIIANGIQRRSAVATAASIRKVIATLNEHVSMLRGLLSQGWESRANVLDATQDLEREQTLLSQTQGQIAQADAERLTLVSQIEETISKFISDGSQALSTSQAKLDQIRQDIVKAASGLQHTRITAPLDGTVQELGVTTLGQVVTSGQQLLVVVPGQGLLEIEALVPNRDIGFVKTGQSAVIKFDAFPFTRYGTVSGTVARVSRDAVPNSEASQEAGAEAQPISAHAAAAAPDPKTQDLVFPVTVRLDRRTIDVDGHAMPLTPGLSATVEIKTGKRRVLEYVLAPLVEVTSQAGHER